jgi:hypothetical protein
VFQLSHQLFELVIEVQHTRRRQFGIAIGDSEKGLRRLRLPCVLLISRGPLAASDSTKSESPRSQPLRRVGQPKNRDRNVASLISATPGKGAQSR